MKKRILSVVLVLVLCMMTALTVHAAPAADLVKDEADLLTGPQATALNAKLQEISSTYHTQVMVYTVESISGDVGQFAHTTFNEVIPGSGSSQNGVMLLVCMMPRQYHVISNGEAGEAIGDSAIEDMGYVFSGELSDGNYAEAFDLFAEECRYYLDGYLNGYPFDVSSSLMISLAIGIVIGLIVAFVLKGQLKSVRKQNEADVYVKPGSMQLTASHDFFLYRTVSRQKRENKSSGSSGSSRHSGGGSF